MNAPFAAPSTADALVAGPRGRRLLLEFALECERASGIEYSDDAFSAAVFDASYHLDPGAGTSRVRAFYLGEAAVPASGVSPEVGAPMTIDEVARRLNSLDLVQASPEVLLGALASAVDQARYWQEPDGEDVLCASASMRAALRHVAVHVAASPQVSWWSEPVSLVRQRSVQWSEWPEPDLGTAVHSLLVAERERVIAQEKVAMAERSSDPTDSWSGEWWSRPAVELVASTRALDSGAPVGLWCVEDGFGWERAEVSVIDVPAGLRVYEVDSAQAWAHLCRRFPMKVTAQVRHDWYRTTGRTGAWVVPDWAAVAEHYSGVHLQVRAYLEAAGTAITVDGEHASVIAGWNPDQTYWFDDNVCPLGAAQVWVRDDGAWRRGNGR
ncbi:hypothetical protein [Demequina sp.]|uniref:hypothetical protein n=1 Tax=Demequina sp. TaxID=2050685 RepID=UPI003A84E146